MNLTKLKLIFADKGCSKIYIKKLSPNDNSKNQVYLGGSFDILNILPISDIITEEAGDWKKERFKAKLNFAWINEHGNIYPAPNSQLILYPKYPEVRFSGFLLKCENPPSELMSQRLPERLLFFSVAKDGTILGFVTGPNSEINKEISKSHLDEQGIFKIIDLPQAVNGREKLFQELLRIYELDWIKSKRLDRNGNILPCLSPNCGGYTLEAELGITPNGYSEPDYLGWEIKQFHVEQFSRFKNAIITLMTPEPTDGFYKIQGAESFIRKYGYFDKNGKIDRMNFGGIHKVGHRHPLTELEMCLIGFDQKEGKIRNTNGKIALLDKNDHEAASWSFSSLLKHWNRKHNQACYIPSLSRIEYTEDSEVKPERQYKYGNNAILGVGTDFQLFLIQMALGNIYYDPGIKMENISTKPEIKKRSQFRIKSQNLSSLYEANEIVDVTVRSSNQQ